jgi:hypothetical protein
MLKYVQDRVGFYLSVALTKDVSEETLCASADSLVKGLEAKTSLIWKMSEGDAKTAVDFINSSTLPEKAKTKLVQIVARRFDEIAGIAGGAAAPLACLDGTSGESPFQQCMHFENYCTKSFWETLLRSDKRGHPVLVAQLLVQMCLQIRLLTCPSSLQDSDDLVH